MVLADLQTSLLLPLAELPHLTLLQVGSYLFPPAVQIDIVTCLAREVPSLLVVGLLGEEGETNWWGIWRRASTRRRESWYRSAAEWPAQFYTEGIGGRRHRDDRMLDFRLVPLEDGHLRLLEEEAEEHRRWTTGSPLAVSPVHDHNGHGGAADDPFEHDYAHRAKFRRTESGSEDVRMGSPVDSTHTYSGQRPDHSRASSAMSLRRMLSDGI